MRILSYQKVPIRTMAEGALAPCPRLDGPPRHRPNNRRTSERRTHQNDHRRKESEPMDTLELDRTESDNAERVELSESDVATEGADDTPEEIHRPLVHRLADIRAECAEVSKEHITIKTKDKGQYSFNGHTIEGVLSSVRILFEKHGVWVMPNLIERSYNGTRCDVIVEFEFINLDDPEDTKKIQWGGSDTDYGGKGFAKAGTNALKEMLKKVFLITDREDRKEETENVEHVTEDQISAKRAQEAEEETRKALEAYAVNLQTTIRTCPDRKDLKALKRESAEQRSKLPKVTQNHFEQEFKDRDEILAEFETDENQETLA